LSEYLICKTTLKTGILNPGYRGHHDCHDIHWEISCQNFEFSPKFSHDFPQCTKQLPTNTYSLISLETPYVCSSVDLIFFLIFNILKNNFSLRAIPLKNGVGEGSFEIPYCKSKKSNISVRGGAIKSFCKRWSG